MRITRANLMRTNDSRLRGRKKPANLSIFRDLPEQAKALEADLSEAIRKHERSQWLERNRAALDAYNERVERYGVFSDGLRSF